MQICKKHWAELRKAIEVRGLSEFVSKTSEEAANKIQEEVKNGKRLTRDQFDPMIAANFALWNNCADVGGIGLLAIEGCPLCELIDNCECGKGDACEFRHWIDCAANEQLQHAKDMGLVADA